MMKSKGKHPSSRNEQLLLKIYAKIADLQKTLVEPQEACPLLR